MAASISQSWQAIDRHIESTEGVSERFAEGASENAILDAATAMNVTFPDDLIESYRVHDGQQQGVEFLFGGNRLWSLSEIVDNHKALINSGSYDIETDIGFADNGGNTVIVIRLGEGPGHGSIYEMSEDGPTELADSLAEYLSGLAVQFTEGQLLWSRDGGGFNTPGDLEVMEEYRELHEQWDQLREGPGVGLLKGVEPGTEAEIVGTRFGRLDEGVIHFAAFDGRCKLRGSLKGAQLNQLIRVRIRVGKRRLLGAPIHDILSWEPTKNS